jgi:toxin ParE1/3/4
VSGLRLLGETEFRIGEIYAYTCDRWGEDQAERYYHGLLDTFEAVAARELAWRPIPGEFGVDGYFCRYQRHRIYWRVLDNGDVGIVTVLHERMHHAALLREAFDD